jgi:solute carrier family 10 (sodium/bile acid cotransporter), member 7
MVVSTPSSTVVGMIVTILAAYCYPHLGRTDGIVHPELFLLPYSVKSIFLLSGLSLPVQQLQSAIWNLPLNLFIQCILFIVWPFGIGRLLLLLLQQQHAMMRMMLPVVSPPIGDGLLILTCLPTTVNMCVVLTSAVRGGNVAVALCNAVLSNLLGLILTPILLLHFLGSDITVPFRTMYIQLSNQVLVPVLIGQILRGTIPSISDMYQRHEKLWKRLQEIILLSILWNAFCNAISSNIGMGVRDGIILLVLLPMVHVLVLAGTWFVASALQLQPWLHWTRGEIVAAMFCSSQKTLAFGLPIIQTIFAGHANLAMYCAPLMILHPLQLIIGSLLVPTLERYVNNGTDIAVVTK